MNAQAADPHRFRNLVDVHPDLCAKTRSIVDTLVSEGHHPIITQGVRTTAQQQALHAQGRTKPGKVVTNADGVVKRSKHQIVNGFGRAVDFAWVVDGAVTWDGPWERLGELAREHGLKWGGDWKFPDRPHVELPNE